MVSLNNDDNHSLSISWTERWLSALGGGVLLTATKRAGTAVSILMGGAGAALLYRAITGRSPIYKRIKSQVDQKQPAHSSLEVDETVTVHGKEPDDVYAFWRDLERLPSFMRHLRSVEVLDEGSSRWTAELPKSLGTLTWEAEITEDEAGEHIAWRSQPGAEIVSAGSVQFSQAPKGRGTEVRIRLSYNPPGGVVSALVGRLLNPAIEQLIRADIRRSKNLLETGEVPTIKGQPSG